MTDKVVFMTSSGAVHEWDRALAAEDLAELMTDPDAFMLRVPPDRSLHPKGIRIGQAE